MPGPPGPSGPSRSPGLLRHRLGIPGAHRVPGDPAAHRCGPRHSLGPRRSSRPHGGPRHAARGNCRSAHRFSLRQAAVGALDRRDDIFFLTVGEIRDFNRGEIESPAARRLAAERRAEPAACETLPAPPPIVFGRRTAGGSAPPFNGGDGKILAGIGVHPGVVRGSARVILRSGVDEVRPGEVLVAPFTDPGWTPYFLNAVLE